MELEREIPITEIIGRVSEVAIDLKELQQCVSEAKTSRDSDITVDVACSLVMNNITRRALLSAEQIRQFDALVSTAVNKYNDLLAMNPSQDKVYRLVDRIMSGGHSE